MKEKQEKREARAERSRRFVAEFLDESLKTVLPEQFTSYDLKANADNEELLKKVF